MDRQITNKKIVSTITKFYGEIKEIKGRESVVKRAGGSILDEELRHSLQKDPSAKT